MTKFTTHEEFLMAFENNDLDEEYAIFIMENCQNDRVLANGNDAVLAQESGYLIDEFLEFINGNIT